MKVEIKSFGSHEGNEYSEIFIHNDHTTISFSDLGARINRWIVKDKYKGERNIVLGFNDASHAHEGKGYYYGATIGRVAGRINRGEFMLKDQAYQLPINDNGHHLHGGPNSFDLKQWSYEVEESEDQVKVKFRLIDEAGTNGYPGRMEIEVHHTYTSQNQWMIEYHGQTDEATLFNPTNHVYFNLNGNNSQPITNHYFKLTADRYLPLKDDVTPTGVMAPVEGTAFDLREPVLFADILNGDDEQVRQFEGFDHPFIFETGNQQATISNYDAGIELTMETSLPAVVMYTQNVVDPPIHIWGEALEQYAGFTLETQYLPDAINHEGFGNIVLEPSEKYYSKTQFQVTALNAKEV